MRKLVLCVVVDVLRHVCVKDGKRSRISWISAAAWNFTVLDSAKFVVLLPQIGFKDFSRSQKSILRIEGRGIFITHELAISLTNEKTANPDN